MTTEPWMTAAACRGMNADPWFPARGASEYDIADAIAICQTCPVRSACLEYAQREQIHHGIWGGCNANERYRLRRSRRGAA